MRILCLIPALGPGGAERVLSYLVAELLEYHEVTLLTWERPGVTPFFALPGRLRYIPADRLGGHGLRRLYRVMSRPVIIRREARRLSPDVVLSFLDTMNTTALISCLGLGVPVVVSERNDPAHHQIGWAKRVARDRAYALARILVVQTRQIGSYFPLSLQPKLRIIPNPIPSVPVVARPDTPGADGRMRLVAVGRLAHQKGLDRLIDAFALMAGLAPDWDLVLIGEGPERAALENMVSRLGLKGRVQLPGVVADVFPELAASHLMAFPSRYEGFPNALAEGLAAGLPAVGYVGVSGVEDLVVNRETGLLIDPAEGTQGMAQALFTLMANAPMRARLGEAARRHVTQWAPEHVFQMWHRVLAEAAGFTS